MLVSLQTFSIYFSLSETTMIVLVYYLMALVNMLGFIYFVRKIFSKEGETLFSYDIDLAGKFFAGVLALWCASNAANFFAMIFV